VVPQQYGCDRNSNLLLAINLHGDRPNFPEVRSIAICDRIVHDLSNFTNIQSMNNTKKVYATGISIGSIVAAILYPIAASAATLYVTDYGVGTISKYDTTTNAVSTFATGLSNPTGLAFDPTGNLFVANYGTGTIDKFTSSGVKSNFATGLSDPTGLAFDKSGNLFVSNYDIGTISKFAAAGGSPTVFASGLKGPGSLVFDATGNLLVGDVSLNLTNFTASSTIERFTPTGSKSTFASGLSATTGLAIDTSGNVFAGDLSFSFTAGITGKINRFAAAGGSPTTFATGLNAITGLAFDPSGNLFAGDVANYNFLTGTGTGTIDRFNSAGTKTTFATGLSTPAFLAFAPTATPTAVPEPFMIIGTLVGSASALRLRQRLQHTRSL
jgi:sugar lactone lactonase YvrE